MSDVQYLLTFCGDAAVGMLVGQLTAGLREQAEVAVQREAAAHALYEAAREFVRRAHAGPDRQHRRALRQRNVWRALCVLLRRARWAAGAPQIAKPEGSTDAPSGMPNLDRVLADWTYQHGQPAGTGTHTLPSGSVLYLP